MRSELSNDIAIHLAISVARGARPVPSTTPNNWISAIRFPARPAKNPIFILRMLLNVLSRNYCRWISVGYIAILVDTCPSARPSNFINQISAIQFRTYREDPARIIGINSNRLEPYGVSTELFDDTDEMVRVKVLQMRIKRRSGPLKIDCAAVLQPLRRLI
jgi:hypothetical protein